MSDTRETATEPEALIESALLFGRLLIRELDAATWARLRTDDVRVALADLGVDVPRGNGTDDVLDRLAAEYFDCFLQPKDDLPLVQSIYEEDSYDGDAARGTREVAQAAGVELDAELARHAPPDQIGVQLSLWAELAGRDADAAREFARRHLTWAIPRLERRRRHAGFYGPVCAAAAQLIEVIGTK